VGTHDGRSGSCFEKFHHAAGVSIARLVRSGRSICTNGVRLSQSLAALARASHTPGLSAASYSMNAIPLNVPLLTFFVLQLAAPA
jgi:hypothetical protein